ncbi:hypothetical protein OKA04_21980 [Luteolibacter flavescens]|uniref:Uncharacterized protein n=1 Tax=Luteolibacter flavescens TaxID=1859460 RepID=A0ABT3FVI1_9BACT|nr:hypothetical protein [Luteolibacter flavescens]MCW1887422.1 hypothetical protein [Luteolibacter flavescens]
MDDARENELARALDSPDPGVVLEAAHAIRHEWDRAVLRALAEVGGRLQKRLPEMEFDGALRANRTHVETALKRIRLAMTDRCLCAAYLTEDLYNPEREAEAGRVRLLEFIVVPEEYTTRSRCECMACGDIFTVEEREYHYSWWIWQRVATRKKG